MRTLLRFSVLCLASLLSMSVYAEEIPNDEIWYTASEKLTETTNSSGLHTNAFNTTISSHTFSDGKANAKSLFLDMYHGVKKEYLQYYLDEYCFKLSRRTFDYRTFDRILVAAVATKPTFAHRPYNNVSANNG